MDSVIKKTKHENDPEIHNRLDQLPSETVIDILSRLPITSLIQFTFVSRSLTSLSRHPHLVGAHLARAPTNGSSCLVLHSDYPLRNQLHFLRLHDHKVRKIYTPFAASMPEFTIVGSCNGLLCLVNTLFVESIILYNPFTRYYSELPKNFIFHDQVVVYGFGFDAVTNNYKVIKIGHYANPRFGRLRNNCNGKVSEVQIYSLSSKTWKNGGVLPYSSTYRLAKWSSPGVLMHGRLHWVSRWGRLNGQFQRAIVSIDLADDSFRVMKNPSSNTVSVGRWVGCHLAALDGYLSAAVPMPPGHGGFTIWVMKEYGVNESWAKMYSVGVYTPVSMISHKMERCSHIWRNMFGRKLVRVLCFSEDRKEVVLEYRGGGLVCYDVENESFRELECVGMPKLYQTVVHVGSLTSSVAKTST